MCRYNMKSLTRNWKLMEVSRFYRVLITITVIVHNWQINGNSDDDDDALSSNTSGKKATRKLGIIIILIPLIIMATHHQKKKLFL